MSSLHRCITSRRALFSCVALALGTGCLAQGYSRPPPPPTVVIQSAPVSDPELVAGAGEDDGDVIYEPEPPVDDIESYPIVVYLGVPTYYVGGRWYRHGSHGWGYYRQEPGDLGRQREAHEHDEHWARAREAPLRRPEHVAPVAPPRPQEGHVPERVAPVAPPRPHETRAPEHVAPLAPPRPHETRAPEHVAPQPQPVPPPHVQQTPVPKRTPTPVKPEHKEPENREPRR